MSTNSTAGAMSEAEERNQAKLTHIINGFVPLWGGLIFWLINKDRSKFMDDQGKEALNFGINIAIAMFVSGILMTVLIGFLLYPIVWGYSIWMGFQSAPKAANGELYRYPICPLRLVK
jgi:uncharacterized Tic20 family protein